jgi:hypothetical protein
MKYFVTASVNLWRYAEDYVYADSVEEAQEIFSEKVWSDPIEWEDKGVLWDTLEVLADECKEGVS